MAAIDRFEAKAPRKGLIDVPADNGTAGALATLAKASGQIAGRLGEMADEAVRRISAEAGVKAGLDVAMPSVDFAFDRRSAATSPAKPFKTGDPVAADLPAHARAFLNAVAGGESGGAYNIRYTPKGGAYFSDLSRHPRIFESGPHGRSTAAGRYQFTATTWDSVGGGEFSPENQDRRAWALAQRDYKARTGRALDADLAVGGLTPAILSALSPTWAAFNANGNRHIATYQESLTRYGTAPAAQATSGASTAVSVAVTGNAGPLPQRPAGTIAGDAYNAAAAEIYFNRLVPTMQAGMAGLAVQHDGDPAALKQALDGYHAGLIHDLDDRTRAVVEPAFARYRFALEREAAEKYQSRLKEELEVSFDASIAARTDAAYRLAASGGMDASAEAALAAELDGLDANIDASPLAPEAKAALKRDAARDILAARVMGGFGRIEDPAARAAYVKTFQEEWLKGEGLTGKLDARSYEALNSRLVGALQGDEAAARKREAALGKAIEGQVDLLEKGWPIPAEERRKLRSEIAATGDPELVAELDHLDALADWQTAHVKARPEVLDAQVDAMRDRIMRDGATDAALQSLSVMEGLQKQMADGLQRDPLGWAERAGVATVEPLDFDDATQLTASLAERRADAAAIGAHYGVAPKFFTPAEVDALKKQLQSSPLALPSLVSGLAAGLGRDTPAAMAEISADAPVLAQTGWLMHALGPRAEKLAVEIGEALQLRAQPGYKGTLPPAAKLRGAAIEMIGGALGDDPAAFAEIMDTAGALFERRALARGLDMENFDAANSPARAAYQEAVDQVLGATMRDGVKYGGIAEVNGMETIAPPDVAADRLEEMLLDLSAEDLQGQGGYGTANGVPLSLSQFRSARLVRVEDGLYRVATGDPAAGDPRYVPAALPSAEEPFFLLDIRALERSQAARARRPGGRGKPAWMKRSGQ